MALPRGSSFVGTHGRSLYKGNIASLQEFKNEEAFFSIKNIRKRNSWGSSWSKWLKPNTPKITIPYYSNSDKEVVIDIYSKDILVNSIKAKAQKGFNKTVFDASFSEKGRKAYVKQHKETIIKKAKNDNYYLPKGKYKVVINNKKQEFEIK